MEPIYIRYKGIRQHVFNVLPAYASGFALLVQIHVDQLHELFERESIKLAEQPQPDNLLDAFLFAEAVDQLHELDRAINEFQSAIFICNN